VSGLVGKRTLSVLGLSVAVVALGCESASDSAAPQGSAVRDSAGIRIVHNSSSVVGDAPLLRLQERIRIGSVSGQPEQEFGFLSDIGVGPGGEIIALDSYARSVRVFTADGTLLREFGGQGQGPGEFQNELLRIAVGGDSALVQDRYRFHLFSIAGLPGRTVTQRITGNSPAEVLARAPQGWVLGQTVFSPAPSLSQRTTIDTFRIFPLLLEAGAAGPPVLEVPSTLRRYLPPDLGRSRSQWLGPRVEAAVRPNGEIFLVRGDAYEIEVFSTQGELLRKITGDVDRIPITGRDFQDALEGSGYSFGAEEFEALGHPEVRPISGRLLVAPSGRVLMKRLDLSSLPRVPSRESMQTWDLISSEGRVQGRVTADGNVQFRILTDSLLYAIARDTLDVQFVLAYSLEPGTGEDEAK